MRSVVFLKKMPCARSHRGVTYTLLYTQVAGEGWFGGGADLTPYYLDDGDVEAFHRFYKDICDRYDDKVEVHRDRPGAGLWFPLAFPPRS